MLDHTLSAMAGFFIANASPAQQRGTLQAVTSDPCLKTPALPHDGGLQPQAEAATAGSAPEEALQALGTHMAEGDGLGLLRLAKKGLSQRNPLKP